MLFRRECSTYRLNQDLRLRAADWGKACQTHRNPVQKHANERYSWRLLAIRGVLQGIVSPLIHLIVVNRLTRMFCGFIAFLNPVLCSPGGVRALRRRR